MSRTLVVTSTSYCIRTKPRGLDRRIPFVEYNPTTREEYEAKLAELQASKVKILEYSAIDHHASVGTDDLAVLLACKLDGTPLWSRSLAADTWEEIAVKVNRDIDNIARPDVACVLVYYATSNGLEFQERRELRKGE